MTHFPAKSILILSLVGSILLMSCKGKKGESDISQPEIVLKLSPSENNPRNSEGDFINLKDGRILFVYSHYTGDSSSDHAPAHLAGRYSEDGGKTWSSEDEIILPNEGGMNVMSVSLLRLRNGDIALFYLRKNSTDDCIPFMRISKDETQTWSDAIQCISDKHGYFVLNNDRVIQLENGRLLMPVALHNTPDGEWKNQADLYCYFSDDNGKTWTAGKKVPNTTEIVTQEPGVIEMQDGRIMMYIRASGGFQQVSFSADQGETWSHIETSNIPSPVSPATIEKIPGTKDWLLVWNNNDGSNPEIAGNRTPFTVAVSKNEGKSWEKLKNLHNDPDGWYCYTAIHFINEKKILLGYCAGNRPAGTGLSISNITRFGKEWIYQ
jgi:hypothetical protein